MPRSEAENAAPPAKIRTRSKNFRREKRLVYLSDKVPPLQPGHPPNLWAYGVDDLADLLGLSRREIHNLATAGKLDPFSLESIFDNWLERIRSPHYERKLQTQLLPPEARRHLARKPVRVKAGDKTYEFSLACLDDDESGD